jgi:hypothetical protein
MKEKKEKTNKVSALPAATTLSNAINQKSDFMLSISIWFVVVFFLYFAQILIKHNLPYPPMLLFSDITPSI